MAVVVADNDKRFETRALSSTRLLLHRRDLHDLVLQSRAQEEVDYLVLLDGQREQINLLQALDLALCGHKNV